MITVTAALLITFIPQDEGRLKEAWPKFVDAWKAIDAYKLEPDTSFFDDQFLGVVARLHRAFDGAGLQSGSAEYLPGALKTLLRIRSRDLLGKGMFFTNNKTITFSSSRIVFESDLQGGKSNPMADLLAALKKPKAADAKTAEADLATTHKLLKSLGITADDTRPVLRDRALRLIQGMVQGEPFPEPRALSDEQVKRCRAWIADLGHEEIERRGTALSELMRADEGSLSLVRESLRSEDAEVTAAVRRLLGYDHVPWTGKLQPKRFEFGDVLVEPAPPEEKPK